MTLTVCSMRDFWRSAEGRRITRELERDVAARLGPMTALFPEKPRPALDMTIEWNPLTGEVVKL
jgi:hypothetical protein